MGEALPLIREKHLREASGRSCELLLAPNQQKTFESLLNS